MFTTCAGVVSTCTPCEEAMRHIAKEVNKTNAANFFVFTWVFAIGQLNRFISAKSTFIFGIADFGLLYN